MLFRQLFEPKASAFTYLVGCEETRAAALIDPVVETLDRDLQLLHELGLTLHYTIETHIHADHVTSAALLRERTGSKAAVPRKSNAANDDLEVCEGVAIAVGTLRLHPLYTPGHTDDHHCYFLDVPGGPRVFTGDALLIDGCGRTDFQNGDAPTLYHSVHEKLFSLPDDTLVYPGHDYQGRRVSSIAQEKARNPRLGDGKTVDDFIAIMGALKLAHPKMMDIAVPANRQCGAVA